MVVVDPMFDISPRKDGTNFLIFARDEHAQETQRASATNPTVSKIEIDHHFAADPFGELCNLDEDLLQFWVLEK